MKLTDELKNCDPLAGVAQEYTAADRQVLRNLTGDAELPARRSRKLPLLASCAAVGVIALAVLVVPSFLPQPLVGTTETPTGAGMVPAAFAEELDVPVEGVAAEMDGEALPSGVLGFDLPQLPGYDDRLYVVARFWLNGADLPDRIAFKLEKVEDFEASYVSTDFPQGEFRLLVDWQGSLGCATKVVGGEVFPVIDDSEGSPEALALDAGEHLRLLACGEEETGEPGGAGKSAGALTGWANVWRNPDHSWFGAYHIELTNDPAASEEFVKGTELSERENKELRFVFADGQIEVALGYADYTVPEEGDETARMSANSIYETSTFTISTDANGVCTLDGISQAEAEEAGWIFYEDGTCSG
ncbi:MAG: hypothetical protein LBR21_07250 [Propionibacteriaceae bacterium]|jgi:hypothetical protein|nr:hypothetical protein [Propionibacteriaceae bacterium]